MSGNLNPDQFFHGTTHNIKDGVVRPANDTSHGDVSEYSFGDPGDMSEGDHAFAIRNDEGYAWHAAQTFHPNGRRARVYEVHEAADKVPGPWNKEHPDFLHHVEYGDPKEYPPHENPEAYHEALRQHQDEWASKTGWKVKQRIDIKPGHQGTFPTVNWNQFNQSPYRGMDANHPSDSQVLEGMHGDEAKRKAARAQSACQVGEPKRRTGDALRAYMMGKPEPEPVKPPDPQMRLF